MKKCSALVMALCIVAVVGQAEERWALLVGIDQYSNEIIAPLKGAANDARALGDALVKYARFPSDHVFRLTSDDKANLPNLGNIITTLDYIASKAKSGDVFLFFFAGHGVFLNKQSYLLAYESDIRPFLLAKTALSVAELSEYMSKIQSANTILILDACRNSPGGGRGDEDNLMPNSFVNDVANIEFRATIYACKPGQRAYGWPGKERGLFSVVLEDALSGKADENNDGNITLHETELYLANRVSEEVKRRTGKIQEPWIDKSGDPRAGNMVLSWTTIKQNDARSLSPDEATVSTELTPRKDPVAEPPSEKELIRRRAENAFSQLDALVKEKKIPESELKPLTQQERAEGWVDATGEYYGENITPEEGRRIALERARRSAVEMALGANKPIRRALMRSVQEFHQTFAALSQRNIYGRIVEEKSPVWVSDQSVQIRSGEPAVPLYKAALKARVSLEESQSDAGFSVSLKLDNSKFMDGEEVSLSVTPTQDCYITVFNILSDHTVLILDVFQEGESVIMPGEQTFNFPTKAERPSGERLRVALSAGRTEDLESILVIATRDDVPFLYGNMEEFYPDAAIAGEKPVLGVLPSYQLALEEISGWLAGIPLERRTFDVQQYRIVRRDQ